jgi:hypothetical protein
VTQPIGTSVAAAQSQFKQTNRQTNNKQLQTISLPCCPIMSAQVPKEMRAIVVEAKHGQEFTGSARSDYAEEQNLHKELEHLQ